MFDGLTSLTTLGLYGNVLTTLPVGVFDGLTSLTTLSLNDNGLTTIPVGVFDGLTSLTTLLLHNNGLATLPAGVFDDLTSLSELSLYNNGLTELPAGVFDGLTSLSGLFLQINALTELPAGVFDNLDSLTRLSLRDNALTTLPSGVFDGLTSLSELWLYNNGLTELPAGVFDGLTSLSGLFLQINALTELPAGVFDNLGSLTRLSLRGNALTTLPAGVFDGLTSLSELWLYNNGLTTLPAGVFDRLTALTVLQLRGNPGAPFAPVAVALPDDGTVSVAGGTVTLDGSGSDGGPWGANVIYSWALTSPASGAPVTFDDAASATPTVTIPALPEGAPLTFTLTVTGRGGTDGVAPGIDTARVTALGRTAGIGRQTELSTAGASSATTFSGGATINGGVSYLAEVPASEPADLVVNFRPAAADVGQEADIYVVVSVPELGGFFQKTSGGIWAPLDLSDLSALRPYTTRILGESEEITVIDGLVGEDANLAGMTLSAYVAYARDGDLATLTYTEVTTPAQLTIAESAADSCPANTTAAVSGETFKGKNVCILTGTLSSDTHLTSNFTYLLNGPVFVGANEAVADGDKVKLTIDAGTTVFAQQGLNYLVIDRGGQLHANGSRRKPVIFTYEFEDLAHEATTGQWGGLILNGNATLNVQGGTAEGEGSSGTYGGANDGDSSGVLTFVQVKYAGQNFTEEDELNGIAFQGAGSGTLVDYVQVHNNSDDGIEFFGGTTNAKHILLTGNEDDALDWTQGWTGKVQFLAIRQNSASDHCIEADSNSNNNDASPRADVVISNLTCAGPGGNETSGILLRQGTSARISNAVLGNFGAYCVDIDQAATFTAAGGSIAGLNGSLAMSNSRLDTACTFSASDGDPFSVADWFGAQTGSSLGGVDLGGAGGLTNGHSLNAVEAVVPSDPFFDQVDYIGAIKDETSDWTAGWSYSD